MHHQNITETLTPQTVIRCAPHGTGGDTLRVIGKCRFHASVRGFMIVFALFGHMAFAAAPLLFDDFSYPDGLITNERDIITSPLYDMNSGSLFAVNGAAWTGVPDDRLPNSTSSDNTNSCIFRMDTKASFLDVAVSFAVNNQGLSSSDKTPPVAWDGLHIWLRYRSEAELYYASINRRDNKVVIKKKVPPGSSNGGTYYELSPYISHSVPYNVWQQVKATVQNNQNGSVTIKLYANNVLLVSATDDGSVGGPPIRDSGPIGIRGDNANLKFDNLLVSASPSTTQVVEPQPISNLTAAPETSTSLTLEWPAPNDGPNHFFRAAIFSVSSTASFSSDSLEKLRFSANGTLEASVSGLLPNTQYNAFVYHSTDLLNWSLASNVAVARTALPPPKNVVTLAGDSQVTISWDPVFGATSYHLYRSRFSPVTKTTGFKIENVTSPHVNTGPNIVNGTPIYMVVTAVNAFGESDESVEVAATPTAP